METSLHRELKRRYAAAEGQTEVRLGRFRIDAVVGDELVEIQHGSLSAIRRKIARLLESHDVRVVKPIVAAKLLVKRESADGPVLERRLSPKRGTMFDLFDELVYFTSVFPHPRLRLELLLVDMEEHRRPGHGRRRRWGRRDHVVDDQLLVAVHERHVLSTADDLWSLLPRDTPRLFDTSQLASALDINRYRAQRVAYCLRETRAVTVQGKRGNAWIYQRVASVAKPNRRNRRAG